MEKYVIDAEVNTKFEAQASNVTDEAKVVSVEVKATPTAPAPPDEFWIVLSAISALLTLLVVV
jgi:hypothetical protein